MFITLIKRFLYRRNVWTPKDPIDKIDILRITKLDYYTGYNMFRGINQHINVSINMLKIIYNTNIEETKLNLPRVDENKWKEIKIANWLTINGVMLENEDEYHQWLDLAKHSLLKFDKEYKNSVYSFNQRLFAPYRLEIYNTLDCLMLKIK